MTSRPDDAEQLALAQQHNAALARTLYAATVERDALRAELEAARAALGATGWGRTLDAGIARKCAWLEATLERRRIERDTLRAEIEAAWLELGAGWSGGTLASGITRKCRWLETLINGVETP